MKKSKQICYNCKHAGDHFRIQHTSAGVHMHCENKEKYPDEEMRNGDISPWDSLKEWWDRCEKFEAKEEVLEIETELTN